MFRWRVRFVCDNDREVEGNFRVWLPLVESVTAATKGRFDEQAYPLFEEYLRSIRFFPSGVSIDDFYRDYDVGVLVWPETLTLFVHFAPCGKAPNKKTFRGRRLVPFRPPRNVRPLLAKLTLPGLPVLAVGATLWTYRDVLRARPGTPAGTPMTEPKVEPPPVKQEPALETKADMELKKISNKALETANAKKSTRDEISLANTAITTLQSQERLSDENWQRASTLLQSVIKAAEKAEQAMKETKNEFVHFEQWLTNSDIADNEQAIYKKKARESLDSAWKDALAANVAAREAIKQVQGKLQAQFREEVGSQTQERETFLGLHLEQLVEPEEFKALTEAGGRSGGPTEKPLSEGPEIASSGHQTPLAEPLGMPSVPELEVKTELTESQIQQLRDNVQYIVKQVDKDHDQVWDAVDLLTDQLATMKSTRASILQEASGESTESMEKLRELQRGIQVELQHVNDQIGRMGNITSNVQRFETMVETSQPGTDLSTFMRATVAHLQERTKELEEFKNRIKGMDSEVQELIAEAARVVSVQEPGELRKGAHIVA